MNDEWLLAAGIIAIPLAIFGLIELAAYLRRRRERAIAQRPKGFRRKAR